jgi:hypothetical protein
MNVWTTTLRPASVGGTDLGSCRALPSKATQKSFRTTRVCWMDSSRCRSTWGKAVNALPSSFGLTVKRRFYFGMNTLFR